MLQMPVVRIRNITTLWSDNQMELCNTDLPRGLKKTLEKYYITVGFSYTYSPGLANEEELFFFSTGKYFYFYQHKIILNEKNLPCHSASGFTVRAVSYLAWCFSSPLGEKSI